MAAKAIIRKALKRINELIRIRFTCNILKKNLALLSLVTLLNKIKDLNYHC